MYWSMGIQVRETDFYDQLGQITEEVNERDKAEFNNMSVAVFHEMLLELWNEDAYEELLQADCR